MPFLSVPIFSASKLLEGTSRWVVRDFYLLPSSESLLVQSIQSVSCKQRQRNLTWPGFWSIENGGKFSFPGLILLAVNLILRIFVKAFKPKHRSFFFISTALFILAPKTTTFFQGHGLRSLLCRSIYPYLEAVPNFSVNPGLFSDRSCT